MNHARQDVRDAQNFANDGAREDGVDREHEPAPRYCDLEGDLEQDVLVEFVVVVCGKMLRIRRPT